MSLTLYYHPLASFCWKPLIALYENETPFDAHVVDLGDDNSRAEFFEIWPMGQFPVLRDESRGRIIPQSTIIVEYLHLHYGNTALIPVEPERALEVRRWDQFYDSYLQAPMQQIVGNSLRPPEHADDMGVQSSRDTLRKAYCVLEDLLQSQPWSAGATFSMADCSAAPALFYANKVEPFPDKCQQLRAYLERLQQRTTFARVLEEAAPYFHLFPYKHEEDDSSSDTWAGHAK